MRAVGVSDLDLAARVVVSVSPDKQLSFVRQLLDDAHASDLWRKRHGTTHPSGGTGSLYAQAALYGATMEVPVDRAYCTSLGVVLQGLEAWRDRNHKVS